MDFHTYTTMRDWTRRADPSDRNAQDIDQFYRRAIADAAAAFAKRFRDKTPAPGGEAALRKMAEDFAAGKQNSDAVSASLSDNPQLAQVRSQMSKLGALQLLVFKDVGPAGPDIYSVRFENGALETRIWLGLNGKIENTNAHPEEGGVGTPVASLRPHFAEIDAMIAREDLGV